MLLPNPYQAAFSSIKESPVSAFSSSNAVKGNYGKNNKKYITY